MIPHNLNFGGTAGTIVNPAVLGLVLLAGLLICILPRRTAIIPFLAAGVLVPYDQPVRTGFGSRATWQRVKDVRAGAGLQAVETEVKRGHHMADYSQAGVNALAPKTMRIGAIKHV